MGKNKKLNHQSKNKNNTSFALTAYFLTYYVGIIKNIIILALKIKGFDKSIIA